MPRLPDERGACMLLTEQVYQGIREGIALSCYPPGALIVEKDVARTYGVSRGTARDALHWLCDEGQLINLPRKGYMVARRTRDEISKIQRLRLPIESLAFSILIMQAGDDQLRAIFSILETPPGQDSEYNTINARFHLELAKLTGDAFIVNTLKMLLAAMSTTTFFHQMGEAYSGQEFHEEILQALLRRDHATAVKWLKQDLFR